jgi:hypothetical protein
MQTYLILRRGGWTTSQHLKASATRSAARGDQMHYDIRWIRSHVTAEADGTVGTVCVYQAASPESIREHARHPVICADEIVVIGETVVVAPDREPAPA